jgi:hypothetical protein
VTGNLGLEKADEIWVHERELIRDLEANHTRFAQIWLELGRQFGAMRALHEKMMSAHCTSSGVTGFSASWFRPAEDVSMPGQAAKTCSAVGLRSRFRLQIKSKLRAMSPALQLNA